jgi:hypothetical protein
VPSIMARHAPFIFMVNPPVFLIRAATALRGEFTVPP